MTNYEKYLRSAEWQRLRRVVFARATPDGVKRPVCEKCHDDWAAEVHHKHYRTLGRERISDLMAVCKPCHNILDKVRVRQTIHNRGLDTYATKKYGDDWECRSDAWAIEEEFSDWLERRER